MNDNIMFSRDCSLTTEKLLWTYEEISKVLSLSRRHIERLVKSGQLPCLKFGRSVRFERDAIIKWLKKFRSRNVS
jgi:excisionase family DNA binding protein